MITPPGHVKEQLEEHKRNKKIPLVEMFGPTIQGEGIVIGQQTYFLRFGLCDYKCTMCDSMHAVLAGNVLANARWLTQLEIFNELTMFRQPGTYRKWVTFSGGNPCIHDLTELCGLLMDDSQWSIAVETQGTFAPQWLDMCKTVTVSPKSPGMGEQFEEVKFKQFMSKFFYHEGLNVKIVAFTKQDLEFAKHVFQICDEYIPRRRMFLSQGNPFPPGVKSAPQNLTDALRHDYLTLFEHIKVDPILSQVKWLPQWHVWLWGNRQGV